MILIPVIKQVLNYVIIFLLFYAICSILNYLYHLYLTYKFNQKYKKW